MDLSPPLETPAIQRLTRTHRLATLSPQDVVQIGQRLYGRRAWMPRMAEALGVRREAVSRWARGLKGMSSTSALLLRKLDAEHRAKKAVERAMRG